MPRSPISRKAFIVGRPLIEMSIDSEIAPNVVLARSSPVPGCSTHQSAIRIEVGNSLTTSERGPGRISAIRRSASRELRSAPAEQIRVSTCNRGPIFSSAFSTCNTPR